MSQTPLTIHCPVRGQLKALARSSDGLTPSEESRRVDAIRYLLDKGYPAANILTEAVLKKFGSGNRNKFRADLAVLDVPRDQVNRSDVDDVLDHAILLGEVKRDNAAANAAKTSQVQPMLDFAKLTGCIAIYWDNLEQRIYWKELVSGRWERREAPAANLPKFGQSLSVKPLTLEKIEPTDNLREVFRRIEDLLHTAAVDAETRYTVILQLLLAKLHDEHANIASPKEALDIQDYKALGTSPAIAKANVEKIVKKAADNYGLYFNNKIPDKLRIRANTLLEILEVLAPLQILGSKRSVIQDFYMHFAKNLYRWDMAQYFTPPPVTDFIVEVAAPQYGESMKDPACGSADFLTAAFRRGVDKGFHNYAGSVWGTDVSPNAVQVAVVNMILTGSPSNRS